MNNKPDSESPMVKAAREGNVAKIDALQKNGADASQVSGVSPVQEAARTANSPAAGLLRTLGAQVEGTSKKAPRP